METEADMIVDSAEPHPGQRFFHHYQGLGVLTVMISPEQKGQYVGCRKLGCLSKAAVFRIIHTAEQGAGFIQYALIKGVTRAGIAPAGQQVGDVLGAFLHIFTIVLPDLSHPGQKVH